MRKLWLHIGSHKTGTTTLQRTLRIAKRKRSLPGLRYIHGEGQSHLNKLVAVTGVGQDMRWQVRLDAIDQRIPPTGDCVISAERLFWLDDQQEISVLINRLRADFDEIRVVVYLRRQDALALSFRKTTIITPIARNFFGASVSALPVYHAHMDRYFDYATKLKLWEDEVGAENVIVRRYETESLFGGDTAKDFFHIIGKEAPEIQDRVNKSWSRSQLIVGLWLLTKGHTAEHFVDLLQDIADDEKLLPARRDAESFVARFAGSNAILARKYDPTGPVGYFGAKFSHYPEQQNSSLSDLPIDLPSIERKIVTQMAAAKQASIIQAELTTHAAQDRVSSANSTDMVQPAPESIGSM